MARKAGHGHAQIYIKTQILPFTKPEDTECIIWPYGANWLHQPEMTVKGKRMTVPYYICTKLYGPPPEKSRVVFTCGNGEGGCCAPNHMRWGYYRPKRSSKITPQQAITIRTLFAMGYKNGFLAKQFDVTPSMITQIINRKRWKCAELEVSQKRAA